MEQIYMIEVWVKKIVLKLEPYVKDEWEIFQEEEEKRLEAERLAALEALKKPKKAKPPKPKKEKKPPPGPSEEELKYMQCCTVQMKCGPAFEFYIAHDNFVAPPPPPPPPKKGKKGAKPKKPKKGKAKPLKLPLPSEPLPQPPYFGVGNIFIFVARPNKLLEIMKCNPLVLKIWNKDATIDCIGSVDIPWHDSILDCVKKSEQLNPNDMNKIQYRDTSKTQVSSCTIKYIRPMKCEADLQKAGEIEFYLRLTCLGNNVITYFIQLPEMERIPARYYVKDEYNLKDMEIVRHWEGTDIEDTPPVAFFYGGPDIVREEIAEPEPDKKLTFEPYEVPFTSSELAIISMGFPKGPCGGINCPNRMDYRGSQHQFIPGEYFKVSKEERKYQHGQFINKRDVHGPCGRLDCPLAKKIRNYLCNEGSYRSCRKPCPNTYY